MNPSPIVFTSVPPFAFRTVRMMCSCSRRTSRPASSPSRDIISVWPTMSVKRTVRKLEASPAFRGAASGWISWSTASAIVPQTSASAAVSAWFLPSSARKRAPGILLAIARPSSNGTMASPRLCMTRVGTVTSLSRSKRSGSGAPAAKSADAASASAGARCGSLKELRSSVLGLSGMNRLVKNWRWAGNSLPQPWRIRFIIVRICSSSIIKRANVPYSAR